MYCLAPYTVPLSPILSVLDVEVFFMICILMNKPTLYFWVRFSKSTLLHIKCEINIINLYKQLLYDLQHLKADNFYL